MSQGRMLNVDLQRHILLTNTLPLPGATSNNETIQVDHSLSELRNLHSMSNKNNVHLQQLSQQKIQRKDALINCLKKEMANLKSIESSTTINYLFELLTAERRIKLLEEQLSESDAFLRKIFRANEAIAKMIRTRSGSDNENFIASKTDVITAELGNDSFELAKAIAEVSASSTLLTAVGLDPKLITSAATEVEEPKPADEQTTKSIDDTEKSPVKLVEPVVEAKNGAENPAEQMETEEPPLLKRFPCDKCNKSFSNMAKLYKHQTKSHASDVEHESRNAEKVKKPLKRLRPTVTSKKMRQKKRNRNLDQKHFLDVVADYCETPTKCKLKRIQNVAKKVDDKK